MLLTLYALCHDVGADIYMLQLSDRVPDTETGAGVLTAAAILRKGK